MNDLTPRQLTLLSHYDDGTDARHFSLQIHGPTVDDLLAIPGQFFMLTVPGYGEAPFTFVSLPDKSGVFTALIHRTGSLTQTLFKQKDGATLGYRGPFGMGWPLFFSTYRVLAIAGGCGLAPLAGVIEEATDANLNVRLSVIYAARNSASQVLRRERERWKRAIRFIETFDKAEVGQRQGSPISHFDEVFACDPPEAVLCCGPQGFIQNTVNECLRRGIPASKIWISVERRMHCGVGLCGHCYIGSSYACVDGPTYRYDRYRDLCVAAAEPLVSDVDSLRC